jgi:hypothetical protein
MNPVMEPQAWHPRLCARYLAEITFTGESYAFGRKIVNTPESAFHYAQLYTVTRTARHARDFQGNSMLAELFGLLFLGRLIPRERLLKESDYFLPTLGSSETRALLGACDQPLDPFAIEPNIIGNSHGPISQRDVDRARVRKGHRIVQD